MQTESLVGVLGWLGVVLGYAWATWKLGRLGWQSPADHPRRATGVADWAPAAGWFARKRGHALQVGSGPGERRPD